jgi:hypothetical protein
VVRIFDGEIDRMLDIASLAGPRGTRTGAPTAAAHVGLATREERVEKVGKGIFITEEIAHFLGSHRAIAALSTPATAPEVGVPLTWIEPAGACGTSALGLFVHLPVGAELVVLLSLFLVADHLVGLVDLLESRLS